MVILMLVDGFLLPAFTKRLILGLSAAGTSVIFFSQFLHLDAWNDGPMYFNFKIVHNVNNFVVKYFRCF